MPWVTGIADLSAMWRSIGTSGKVTVGRGGVPPVLYTLIHPKSCKRCRERSG